MTLESADYLLPFRPVDVVHRIAPRPLLVVHGANNRLHHAEEAQQLYDLAAQPKRLELLPDRGHTEWMLDDDPTFKLVVDVIDKFLADAFGPVRCHASGEG